MIKNYIMSVENVTFASIFSEFVHQFVHKMCMESELLNEY